jgi:hypothetical protein
LRQFDQLRVAGEDIRRLIVAPDRKDVAGKDLLAALVDPHRSVGYRAGPNHDIARILVSHMASGTPEIEDGPRYMSRDRVFCGRSGCHHPDATPNRHHR